MPRSPHQLVLYEHGGLATFVRRVRGGTLLDRAGGVEAWSDAPMGAYELVAEHADRLVWLDLGDHQVIETTNLGGASIMAIGEAAIGRIVRASDTALFESAPLCVPPDVATTVADAPTAWVDALAEGCRSEWGEVLGGFIAKMHHFDLLCDLPVSVRRQLVQPLDPDLRPDHVGTDGNGSDYGTALVLAAALLEPGTAETLAPLLVASDAPVLHDWAAVMSAPADILCRRLADGLAAVA